MPPKPGAAPTPGRFQTIVGCNDCRGGSLRYPSYLQTWHDDGTTLTLETNATIRFAGTPAAYSADTGCPGSYAPPPPPGADQAQSEGTSQMCGLRTPSQSIIRTTDGNLLMAFCKMVMLSRVVVLPVSLTLKVSSLFQTAMPPRRRCSAPAASRSACRSPFTPPPTMV